MYDGITNSGHGKGAGMNAASEAGGRPSTLLP